MCNPIVVSTGHVDAPWITADLAILNEAAVDVGLDVDLQLLAAERTRDQKLVWHLCNPTAMRDLHSAGQEACQRRLHCGGPDFISLRGGMQKIVHEVFGNRPIGGEKPVADIQI